MSTIDEHLNEPRPLIDVRSPCEFAHAHIPQAINIPLFTDDERAQVGIEYKKSGQRPAIEKGLSLVNFPRILAATRQYSLPSPIDVYCARGGMRSSSMAWLFKLLGHDVRVIEGGYKFFRRWVLKFLQSPFSLLVLGGETGSGKTQILHDLADMGESVIDLEALAHHRGSVFGEIDPQPTQEQFENDLAFQLFHCKGSVIWVEDESRRIGNLMIPNAFFEQMQKSPLMVLEVPFEERLQHCLKDYLPLGEQKLSAAIHRLQRRLGSQNTQKALDALSNKNFEECGRILLQYYDKKYRYSISIRKSSIPKEPGKSVFGLGQNP
jgi:tRNA 2-selenouridine synthase